MPKNLNDLELHGVQLNNIYNIDINIAKRLKENTSGIDKWFSGGED